MLHRSKRKHSGKHTLALEIPGLSSTVDIPFPPGKLPVCSRCKDGARTKEICREVRHHTDPPWFETFICITLDSTCFDSHNSLKVNVKFTAVNSESRDDVVAVHIMNKEIPICVSCKEKNYKRELCREQLKHRRLPYCTSFITLKDISNSQGDKESSDTTSDYPNQPMGKCRFMTVSSHPDIDGQREKSDPEINSIDHEAVTETSSNVGSSFLENIHQSRTFLCNISSSKSSFEWVSIDPTLEPFSKRKGKGGDDVTFQNKNDDKIINQLPCPAMDSSDWSWYHSLDPATNLYPYHPRPLPRHPSKSSLEVPQMNPPALFSNMNSASFSTLIKDTHPGKYKTNYTDVPQVIPNLGVGVVMSLSSSSGQTNLIKDNHPIDQQKMPQSIVNMRSTRLIEEKHRGVSQNIPQFKISNDTAPMRLSNNDSNPHLASKNISNSITGMCSSSTSYTQSTDHPNFPQIIPQSFNFIGSTSKNQLTDYNYPNVLQAIPPSLVDMSELTAQRQLTEDDNMTAPQMIAQTLLSMSSITSLEPLPNDNCPVNNSSPLIEDCNQGVSQVIAQVLISLRSTSPRRQNPMVCHPNLPQSDTSEPYTGS